MAIKFSELVETHGEPKARQIGDAICKMHGGMGLTDFMSHHGGIDVSGCSDADQKKIENLIATPVAPTQKKDGDK